MENRIVQLVLLPVGVVIGIGIGLLIAKPKITQRQEKLDQLTAQMQTAKAESEEIIKKASAEIARKENELTRTQNTLMQTVKNLSEVSVELEKLQSQGQPAGSTAAAQTEPAVLTASPAAPKPATVSAAASTTPAGTKEYTVKEGDSLWNIAANELGNGIRFKEIIDLNQGITENTVLREGMKLKIPAK